jgi:hypothetical protein
MATPVVGLPRLAGRLTADLILTSPQEMNAISEYQIDLRGACPQRAQTTSRPPPVGLRAQGEPQHIGANSAGRIPAAYP